MAENDWSRDSQSRHNASGFQVQILEQKPRDGGGYEAKVRMPGGYILEKIPIAPGNTFVGGGKAHTGWMTMRQGDKNKFEITHVSGDPSKAYTPETPSGFVQNPANKNQRVVADKDGVHIQTDGKPVKINDKVEISKDGVLKWEGGASFDLKNGILKGSNNTINLNTGEITGPLTSSGPIHATNIP